MSLSWMWLLAVVKESPNKYMFEIMQADARATVYKRALDRTYTLKLKQSRQFFNDVVSRYPSFLFSMNSFEDQISSKLGLKECLDH